MDFDVIVGPEALYRAPKQKMFLKLRQILLRQYNPGFRRRFSFADVGTGGSAWHIGCEKFTESRGTLVDISEKVCFGK